MAKLEQTYVADDLPKGTGGDFSPLPEGWYSTTISEAGLQSTKDGTGSYIKLRLDVTGPSHQGRVLFANLNIRNKSAKAEDIANQQLGEIMRAIGLPKLDDTDQLIGRSLSVKVKTSHSEQYGDKSECKAFKSIDGSSPSVSVAAPSKATPPPWAKK